MNFIDIIQLPNAVSQAASAIGLSSELVCSTTVNMAILTAVLLGAVWLVAPYEPKGRRASRMSGHKNS